jgi:threonine synthase
MVRNHKITMGDKIYLVVPSGNFGNALGGYYAKKAGLPIEKILIASNINNILTEWL